MSVTFERRGDKVSRERPDLSPPITHKFVTERYIQRLSAPRMPPPAGDGWRKNGPILRDRMWVTRWSDAEKRYVFGPANDRIQHWVRDRI